ncbi:hypothetical protein AB6A40_007809 [Gnathostoma spinigerum]|uniref:Nudix hydrolase domain-containing protein n=1 Tax=Gnathostoma spinigerum TaxID=75299 RepID=A0ABD6ENK5_9BILA
MNRGGALCRLLVSNFLNLTRLRLEKFAPVMETFPTVKDAYDCVSIDSKDYRNLGDLKKTLSDSLTVWKNENVGGIWVKVRIQDSWWVPLLASQGFIFHHTQPDYVMMTKWLLDRDCTLPRYPFTQLGVGGLVVKSTGEILLMKERRGPYMGWKYPGGLVDPGEEMSDAAEREVFEETGIQAEPIALLCFRHVIGYRWGLNGDIYCVFLMKLKKEDEDDIHRCSNETSACQWFSREEIGKLPEDQFRPFHRNILQRYDKWVASGRRGCYSEKFHDTKFGRDYTMYFVD